MKIFLSSALVTSLILCGCSSRAKIQNHIPANSRVYDDTEGYAVLSMLLDGASQETHAGIIRINMVTHVESVSATHSLEDCMKIPDEFREAANDYEQRAKTAYLLRKKFTMATPYDLAGETRIVGSNRQAPSDSDKDIAAKISTGTFYLSPVGFDARRMHAIAYENYICGNRCGWGSYHLLRKNFNRWEEANDVSGCSWRQ